MNRKNNNLAKSNHYFIAIVAPGHVDSEVREFKYYMRDRYGCTVALRSPAHITLVPPFWMDDSLEDELVKDLAVFASRQASFPVSVQNFDAFSPRVIFLAVQENARLGHLKLSLEEFLVSLNKYPVRRETRPFHPHMTIANRDLRKKDFLPAFEHFKNVAYDADFKVDTISLLIHNGTAWTVKHSWTLGGT